MYPQLTIDVIETIANGLLVNAMVHIQLLSRCIVSILVYLSVLRGSKSDSLHNLVFYIPRAVSIWRCIEIGC